jgi:hypothetical protein
MKMDLKEILCGGRDCIYLGHNSDQWRDFVNTVMSLWVP